MSDLFYDVLLQAGIYLNVMLLTFIIFNFLSKGYLRNYLTVKASRGKKVLVRVLSLTGYYYKPGVIQSNFLSFKNRAKAIDSARLRKGDLIDEMGVKVVVFDEILKKIIPVNNDPREGHDTEHFDNILKRALYKPSMKDNPRELILIVICVISAIASILTLYFVYSMQRGGGVVGVV